MRPAKLGLFLLVVVACEGPPASSVSGRAVSAALRLESDQPARVEIDAGALHVDRQGALWRRTGATQVLLLEHTAGRPAILGDGSIVISRRGADPGETDLWLVPPSGDPRPLAPALGADDLPAALPDGRVAFVSNRTTVASIWIVDPRTDAAEQLTNRGLSAGRDLTGFVPPPRTAEALARAVEVRR